LVDNLALCAALVDVRISSAGGAVAFECSEASPLARAIIDSKSSGAVIARALGLSPADRLPDAGGMASNAGMSAPPKRRESPSPSSNMLEEISTLMNADLLVLKSVNRAGEQTLEGMEDADLMHDEGGVLDSPDN
jgi:hypothetical protein